MTILEGITKFFKHAPFFAEAYERAKTLKLRRYSSVISIAVLIGFTAGLANIIFRFAQEFMYETYFKQGYEYLVLERGGWYNLALPLLPVLGALLLIPWAIIYGPKEVYGYGFSRFLENVNIRGGILKARTIYLKTIAPALTIGTGGSAGIEGPIAQIGGAIGSNIGRLFRLSGERIKLYIAAGSAGAVAATFNAPITGVMFAIEIVLLGNYELASFMSIILSSGIATVVSRAVYGEVPAFPIPQYDLVNPVEIIFYIILGLIVGIIAVTYIKVFHGLKDKMNKIKINPHAKPVIGALLVGIIGIFFPQVMGNGYEFVAKALSGEMVFRLMFFLIFMKILATSITLGFGGAGGVFAPALFIGAMTGGAFGSVVQRFFPNTSADPGAYATVGVGAFLTAVTHAPLTGIFLLFEMTGNYKIIIPVMIASIVGAIVCRVINYDSIDTVELTQRGIDIHGGKESVILNSISVGNIMDTNFQTIHQDDNLNDLIKLIIEGRHFYFPVVDDNGRMTGIISLQDVKSALFEEDIREFVKVGYASSKKVFTLKPSDHLGKANEFFYRKDIKELPVVSEEDNRKVIGMIGKDDIMEAYQRELLKRSKVEHCI